MRKNTRIKLKHTALAVILIFHLTGCGILNTKGNIDLEKACICVVETRGYDAQSALVFYDESLEEVGVFPLYYATLGQIFYTPSVYNGELYIVPQGIADRKDEKKVLKVNLSSLNTEIYTIDQYAINSISVNDNFIYSANTLNGDSHISKCNKSNKLVSEYVIERMYVSKLVCTDKRVFAFASISEKLQFKSYLFIFDEELNLLNQVDITEYGYDQYKAVIKGDMLYFSNSTANNDDARKTVGVYSIADNSIRVIKLSKDYPHDIMFYDDKLLVSHFDIVTHEGGGLSIYNPETSEAKYIDLNHGAEQMTIKGDYIYFLAKYKVYKYKLEANDLKCEKIVDVPPLCKEFFYCTGLFSF